jgi:hypothetical protein
MLQVQQRTSPQLQYGKRSVSDLCSQFGYSGGVFQCGAAFILVFFCIYGAALYLIYFTLLQFSLWFLLLWSSLVMRS